LLKDEYAPTSAGWELVACNMSGTTKLTITNGVEQTISTGTATEVGVSME